MGALHELLAAESALRKTAELILQQISQMFASKPERLHGLIRTYHPEEEFGKLFPDERLNCATTIDEELIRFTKDFGAWIDAAVQKEVTNTKARAELVVDNIPLGTFPATALLNLEGKLDQIINLYQTIPVLDPAVQWVRNEETNQWQAPTETRYKTEKRQEGIVLYPATEEHPAQTQLITRDVRIGRYELVNSSGALARSDALARIGRAKRLLVATKKARAAANKQEADNTHIAERIFNFINGSKPQS